MKYAQTLLSQLRVMFAFLWRDSYVESRMAKDLIINYGLLWPIPYAVALGYIQVGANFGGDPTLRAVMFAGNILLLNVVVNHLQTIPLLFDLEGDRYVDFQRIVLDPRLVILQRIIFSALFGFLAMAPFFPMSKLLLQSALETSHTNWPALFLVLLCGSFCSAAYNMVVILFIPSSRELWSFWNRVQNVLVSLGGFWIPWYITNQFSGLLAKAVLLTPFVYFSEGLRQAIIGGEKFLPLSICLGGMLAFTALFTLVSFVLFKRKVDYVA